MPYFKYNNKFCYFEEYGNGMPLLFLHGNTASSKMFIDLIEPFAINCKVILIDFLGHGRSDRIEKFATDLWFDESLQVIAFLEQSNYKKVNIIGSSGGALVAINVALERPDLVNKIIADSFEGEVPLKEFVENIIEERQNSKQDEGAKAFYYAMQGQDWESVVDNDTTAIFEHAKSIGKFFHKSLNKLHTPILLTGSRGDEFANLVNPEFYEQKYSILIEKFGCGKMHIFKNGGHPALLSNRDEFIFIAKEFLFK